jgi:hypothetical protein
MQIYVETLSFVALGVNCSPREAALLDSTAETADGKNKSVSSRFCYLVHLFYLCDPESSLFLFSLTHTTRQAAL